VIRCRLDEAIGLSAQGFAALGGVDAKHEYGLKRTASPASTDGLIPKDP
jgi:hypothetical protein